MSSKFILYWAVHKSKNLVKILSISLLLSGLATSGLASPAHAVVATLYVKPGGLNTVACNDWANACSLQHALAMATSGDSIWAKQGTYKPGNVRSAMFTLVNGVSIYGGFTGTESALGQRNFMTHITILSGNIGNTNSANDNSYHVLTGSGTNSTAVLNGFTITAGFASGSGFDATGAGMLNINGNPTLKYVIFTGNHASSYGGGMYNANSSPSLTNVTFSGNSASSVGGGMFNQSSSPTLNRVTFNSNMAVLGGGIYNYASSSPVLTNVTFVANIASNAGGGMFNQSSSPTMTNATFSGNSAQSNHGGAMYNDSTSPISNPIIYDSIFWGDGSEIISNVSYIIVMDSIVPGGCPVTSYSTCTNVIQNNPQLGALANNGGYTKTKSLGAGSSALDAGGGNSTCAPTDQRGVTRPQGGGCDIGAYEVKVMNFTSIATYDGWVLESGKGSKLGGSLDSTAATFRVGDNSANRRYRGVLSFNTASIPDGATVVSAQVRVRQLSIIGNPFGTQGSLMADLVKPYFGSSLALVNSDWQAPATVSSAGSFLPDGSSYWTPLNSSARSNINKTGTTQFRLRFSTDAYNGQADYRSFYSGNTLLASYRPRLIVYYNP